MYQPPYTLRFATSQPVALIYADTTLWPILTTRFRYPGCVSGGRLPYLLEVSRDVVQPIFCQVSEFRGLNRSSNSPNVDGENSIPSWFSSIQLFACSGALWTVAGLERSAGARTSATGWVWPLFFCCYLSTRRSVFTNCSAMSWKKRSTCQGFFTSPGSSPGRCSSPL